VVKQECLSEGTVIEFVDGVISPAARSVVEAHVAACWACNELVIEAAAALRDGTRPLAWIGRPPASRLPTGSRVGRYQILDRVGRGGMGEVYAAYHPDLDRRIALKVVHEAGTAAADRQARLLREARAIARLSHPNVVAVYDAGTVADRVYVAMEFVEGMTIDRWLAAARRSWREILRVFTAAGRGLAAAHAAGLVHRDFKPQNVMIARDGSVRVMDFGLARLTAVESASNAPAVTPPPPSDDQPATALSTVTQAGTVVGTPAYMSPEQFRGDPADARSDQFSFCVALYEALYGVRPFRGENLLSLTMSVTEGELRSANDAAKHGVPVWIRRAITLGLRRDPADRFPSMQALIDRLEDDPAIRRRRRLGAGAVVAVVVATMLVAWQITSQRRAAAEREIARHVDEGTRATAEARKAASEARSLRQDAFAAFDRPDRRNGELLWRQVRARLPRADASYDRAERSLETAFTLDSSREQHRSGLADLRREHLLFAEDFRLGSKTILLEERLAAVDLDGSRRKALTAPGTLELRTRPPASRIVLERYERDPATGRRTARPVGPLDASRATTSLAPGSYRLQLDGPGLASVIYPFEIRRSERTVTDLILPPASAVPKDFVYVPAGTFWFGDADEQLRTQFLDAVPVHQRRTDAYLIARHETTYEDWIAFLNDLAQPERTRHVPVVSGTARGALALQARADGWHIAIQPSGRRYEAKMREPISYVGRNRRSRQDWLRFPIGGVSPDDVTRYLTWLRESGRLSGARLCSEREWERAARGADERLFPHGDELTEDDANIDITYERVDGAYGPDEIGSHPASRSPFDVDDLAGNIMEIVASDEIPGGLAIRGGGYYFSAASARSSNRLPIPRSFRDVAIGLRVCADAAVK
jgi:formylglycine-generating enzyme required for sulfatase activity